jgi:superoxide reductase
MNRRRFLGGVSAGSLAGMFGFKSAWAKTNHFGAGALYYTETSPGRWAAKVAGHLPQINKVSAHNIQVVTGHEMKAYEHYIVKHQLFDQNFQFIAEKLFNPEIDRAAASEFSLPDTKGQIYVVSICNQHDAWVNTATI